MGDSKNEHKLSRGTEIIMHLKEGQSEFLEERRLKEIIKKHSEFIGPEILLWVSKEVEKEVPEEDEEVEAKDDDEKSKAKVEEVNENKDDPNHKAKEPDTKDVETKGMVEKQDVKIEDAVEEKK